MDTSNTEKEELTITYGMVQEIISLSKLQLKNVFSALNKPMPEKTDVLVPAEIAILLFANLLEKLTFLQAEQRVLLLGEVGELAASAPNNDELCLLQFSDGRFAAWTGHAGILDLETGENLPERPVPPQEMFAYNLNEVYRRAILKIEKRSGMYVKKQNDAGNVEESSDLRDRTDHGLS